MIGWLYRMIVGRFDSCRHNWETIGKGEVCRVSDGAVIGHRYDLRCKSCGDVTYRNT